ncbi:hypothetical protein RJT34_17108 [Clitoria ternatea]|uniref:Methylenetetrahydrofolate reductase n=1 Tax=Clitoria ternatea TaxID=43366 RepID=A0AAN9J9M3_CLITE
MLRNKVCFRRQCFIRFHSSASSSALMLEDQVFDQSPKICTNFEFNRARRELFPLVGRVFKSLNWRVASEIKFGSWVESHGFCHSINCFRIIIHTFALAGMRLEVFALLRDVVGYCDMAKYDKFELFSTLLDSPCHVERSVVVFDVLIKVFASNSMLENALDVFVNAKRIRLELDIKTCNFLLKCLVEANLSHSHCFNAVIYGFCKKGGVCEALQVMEEMKSSGVLPDVYSYSILIDAFCKKGDVMKGLDLMQEMELYQIQPSIVSYTSLIHGLCKMNLTQNAVDIFRKIGASSHKYDRTVYETLIDGFCRQGDLNSAIKLLKEMINTIACNYILAGSCRSGHFKEALTLLEDFQEHGFDLNPHSYNAIIYELCKENYPERALELLPRMLKRNVLPGVVNYRVTFNTASYTILISIFSRSCKMHEACGIFKEMKERGLRPDQISYTTLIASFCDAREMNKAWALFEEMSREGCLPNVITYTCLIDGFCKSNRIDWATWVFDKMNRDSVIPDVVTYTVLIAWYQSHGYIDQAHKLYEVMKANGLLPDERAHNVLGLEAGAIQEVETTMHLTCTNMPVDKIDHALQTIKSNGLQNVLALRSDPPMDTDIFLKFVNDCRQIGITCPIVPGIKPINNYKGFLRMTGFCKTKILADIIAALEPIKDNEEAVKSYGIHLGTEMCKKILEDIASLYTKYGEISISNTDGCLIFHVIF